MMTTDAELLESFAHERSDAAFAELVSRHVGMVYAAALRHVGGDAHLAKDVTQVVFAALARKAERLRGRGGLAGWLYLSTHHAAAQVVRAERRRRTREEAHAMNERIMQDDSAAEWERLRPELDAAMRELGEADREAVLLRFFEQRAFAQVGAALNVSEDAARMRVERALEKLRALLGRRGITSTGAALGMVLANQAGAGAPAGLAGAVTTAALAEAGAAGGTIFMKTLMVTVSAVSVVAIGGWVYQARQGERLAADAAFATTERDAMSARLKAMQVRVDEAEQRAEAVEARAVAAEKANVHPAPAAPAATARPAPGVVSISMVAADGTVKGTTHFEDTPEGRRVATRNAVGQTFAAFFRRMGWDERQQALFKDLWVERKEAEREKMQRARAGGGPVDRATAQAVLREAAQEFDERMRTVFGERAAEARRDYERQGAFRHVAEETAKRLFHSNAPLTAVQADRLGEIMALNARRPDGTFDIGAMDREAVYAQAQGMLAPAQLAAFREVEAELRRQRELEQRAREQRAAAGQVPPRE